jgi:hypothetical protein
MRREELGIYEGGRCEKGKNKRGKGGLEEVRWNRKVVR